MNIKGFCQVKKIQKFEKNTEVCGWVKPKLGIFFFFFFFCVLFSCFQMLKKKYKKWIGGWVGGVWPIRVFLEILDFFNLTRPPKCFNTILLLYITIGDY